MEDQETQLEREVRLKSLYQDLEDKQGFAIKLAKELSAKRLIGAPRTILTHWFSDAILSGSMPTDKKRLRIIEKHLEKAVKKTKR